MTTFKAFWHGPPLTYIHRAALRSFLAHGHSVQLFAYTELSLPAGVDLRDAAKVLPESELFYFTNPQTHVPDLGPFSDVFRFKLLADEGGWYVDVDTFCMSSDIPPYLHAWARQEPRTNPSAVGTGQIALPPNSRLACDLFERATVASRGFERREAVGPKLISRMVAEIGLPLDMNGSPASFYPLSWIESFKLWLPRYRDELADRTGSAAFLPYYQSLPRYMGLLDRGAPPAGSYLRELVDRFRDPSQGQHADDLTPDEVQASVDAWFSRNAPWADAEFEMATGASRRNVLPRHDAGERGAGDPAGSDPMSKGLTQALGRIDEAIVGLLRERERLIGEVTDERRAAAAVAPFSVPFALGTKRAVKPFEPLVPGFWIGYPPEAEPTITVLQRANADNLLSPPDHLFTVVVSIEAPGDCPWLTLEREIDPVGDRPAHCQVTVCLKAKASRPIDVRLELSVPTTDGDERRFPLGSLTLSREYEALFLGHTVDLAGEVALHETRPAKVIGFLPVDFPVDVTLAYVTILLTRT